MKRVGENLVRSEAKASRALADRVWYAGGKRGL